LYTLYAHLDRVTVKKGSRVNCREQIGTVGSTGRSSGPHLHFEAIEGIEEVDPTSYFPEA
jgi:murein DD-endopeptidase MepM/ murein hydrolase activator NlpD